MFCLFSHSQKKREDKLLRTYSYEKLIERFEKKSERDSLSNSELLLIAEVYSKTGRIHESFELYSKLYYLDQADAFTLYDWNQLIQGFFADGKNKDAYRVIYDNIDVIKEYNFNREKEVSKLSNLVKINNVNSDYSEFSPFYIDSVIYFASDRSEDIDLHKVSEWTGTPYLSIYSSNISFNLDSLIFDNVRLMKGKINDRYHTSNLSFSKKLNSYILTKVRDNHQGLNHAEIYFVERDGEKLGKETEFKYNNDEYSIAHAVYVETLDILVFSSDMPGGYGGLDLYYCKRENDSWSEIVNFGPEINTKFDEAFPSYNNIVYDGIIFSSNGRGGYGYFDLYQFEFNNAVVSDIRILQPPLNSDFDDFGISFITANSGFISSNREGDDNLFYFIPKLTKIFGKIINDSTLLPEKGVTLLLFDKDGYVKDSTITDENGNFEFKELQKDNYGIIPVSDDNSQISIKQSAKDKRYVAANFVTLMNQKNQITDTVSLYEEDLTLLLTREPLNRPCLTSDGRGPMPGLEAKVINGKVELVPSTYSEDNCFELKKLEEDQIFNVLPSEEIAVLLKDSIYTRCVVYENGDKALNKVFYISVNGITLDTLKTDHLGCIKLKKLYASNALIIPGEEDVELVPRYRSNGDLIENLLSNEEFIVVRDLKQKCVIYKDGKKATFVKFIITKDEIVLDTLVTNVNGCLVLSKLYDDFTFIQPLEEDVEMVIRKGIDGLASNNVNSSELIILEQYARRCVVYENGDVADNVVFVVTSDGIALDTLITDASGCMGLKKLYADNSMLIPVEEDVELVPRIKKNGELNQFLVNDTDDLVIRVVKKKCVVFEDGSKASFIKFIIDENGLIRDTVSTNIEGCIVLKKLYADNAIILPIEEDVFLTIRKDVNDVETNSLSNSEVIIVSKANKRCAVYENGTPALNRMFVIKSEGIIVDTLRTDTKGCIHLKKLYADNSLILTMEEDVEIVPRYNLKGEVLDNKVYDSTEIVLRKTKLDINKIDTLILEDIIFNFNDYSLTKEALVVLENLTNQLKENSTKSVEIRAHTDSRGSSAYNISLSEKRAKSVENYLIKNGIKPTRLNSKGFGETDLINNCSDNVECSELEHKANRRIEFIFY